MTKINGDYLTPEEFRAKVGYSNVQSVYRAIRRGQLEYKKVGRTVLIPVTATLRDRRIKDGRYIGLRNWVNRKIVNPEDL